MSRELSSAAQALHITPSNELCWERQLGGTAFSRTFRVKVPGWHGGNHAAIKMVDIALVARARGVPAVRVWKSFLADVALVNSLPPKCDRILGYDRLTTNPERTHLYMWKRLGGNSLAHFAFSEERQIMQATKFRRFSYLVHRYILQLAQALAAIHADGLVHGSVRLENAVLDLGRPDDDNVPTDFSPEMSMKTNSMGSNNCIIEDHSVIAQRRNRGDDDTSPPANILLTDALIGRNISFDTLSRTVYWPKEMFSGVDGSKLSAMHCVKATQESDCFQLGLLIVELVTSRRLTEVSLAPLAFQPHKLQQITKAAQATCPEAIACATSLLSDDLRPRSLTKRATAADVANRLKVFVEGHKMHRYYCPAEEKEAAGAENMAGGGERKEGVGDAGKSKKSGEGLVRK